MSGTHGGQLKTFASVLPRSDIILDPPPKVIRPVLSQDALDLHVHSLGPPPILFQILEHACMSTPVILRHLESMLRVSNVFADTVDCRLPMFPNSSSISSWTQPCQRRGDPQAKNKALVHKHP